MTYCTNCIHYKVCGNEGVDDSAMTFCADKQTSEDLVSRQAVLDIISDVMPIYSDNYHYILEQRVKDLPSAEKTMQVELEADGYADGELVYDYGRCPECGWEFEEGDKDWEEPYCCHCGQKLKWFESEK